MYFNFDHNWHSIFKESTLQISSMLCVQHSSTLYDWHTFNTCQDHGGWLWLSDKSLRHFFNLENKLSMDNEGRMDAYKWSGLGHERMFVSLYCSYISCLNVMFLFSLCFSYDYFVKLIWYVIDNPLKLLCVGFFVVLFLSWNWYSNYHFVLFYGRIKDIFVFKLFYSYNF